MTQNSKTSKHRIAYSNYYWEIMICCVITTVASISLLISLMSHPVSQKKQLNAQTKATVVASKQQPVSRTIDSIGAERDQSVAIASDEPVSDDLSIRLSLADKEDEPAVANVPQQIEPVPFYCDKESYSPSEIYNLTEWSGCTIYTGRVRSEPDVIDYYLSLDYCQCIYDDGNIALFANAHGYFWGIHQGNGDVHLQAVLQNIPCPYIVDHGVDDGAVVSIDENGFWYTGSVNTYFDDDRHYHSVELGTLYYSFSSNTCYYIKGSGMHASPDERFLFVMSQGCLIDREHLIVQVIHSKAIHEVPYLDTQGHMILLRNMETRYINERYTYEEYNQYQYYSFDNAACYDVKQQYCSNVVYIDLQRYIRKGEIYYELFEEDGLVQQYSRLEVEGTTASPFSHQVDCYWLCGNEVWWYYTVYVPEGITINKQLKGDLGEGSVSELYHFGVSGRFVSLKSNRGKYRSQRVNCLDLMLHRGHCIAEELRNFDSELSFNLNPYEYYSRASIVYNSSSWRGQHNQLTYITYDLNEFQLHLYKLVFREDTFVGESDLSKLIRESSSVREATDSEPTNSSQHTQEPITEATVISLLTPETQKATTEVALDTDDLAVRLIIHPTEQTIETTETPLLTPPPHATEDENTAIINASTASTYLRNDNGLTQYTSDQLIDGDEETCWQFRTSDIQKLSDAYVELSFSRGCRIQTMRIKNGFWKFTKGFDQYVRNSRPKKVDVSFLYEGQDDYSDAIKITLKDDKKRKDWQVVNIGVHENVQAVRVRILSIYKGSKFPKDVAISEIEFE